MTCKLRWNFWTSERFYGKSRSRKAWFMLNKLLLMSFFVGSVKKCIHFKQAISFHIEGHRGVVNMSINEKHTCIRVILLMINCSTTVGKKVIKISSNCNVKATQLIANTCVTQSLIINLYHFLLASWQV